MAATAYATVLAGVYAVSRSRCVAARLQTRIGGGSVCKPPDTRWKSDKVPGQGVGALDSLSVPPPKSQVFPAPSKVTIPPYSFSCCGGNLGMLSLSQPPWTVRRLRFFSGGECPPPPEWFWAGRGASPYRHNARCSFFSFLWSCVRFMSGLCIQPRPPPTVAPLGTLKPCPPLPLPFFCSLHRPMLSSGLGQPSGTPTPGTCYQLTPPRADRMLSETEGESCHELSSHMTKRSAFLSSFFFSLL